MTRTFAAPTATPGSPKSRHRSTDEYLLTAVTATSYIGTLLALNALSYLPRFDTSGSVFGRWDSVHFFSVARNGYEYEQQVAFQPGWHALLHSGANAVGSIRQWLGIDPPLISKAGGGRGLWVEGVTSTPDDIEIAAIAINLIARIAASLALYRLTCRLFNRKTAVAAGLLYAYPPSPAAMLTYTEPAFAAAYFAGLLACSKRRWLGAALCFAAATSLRATGVFSAAVLAWALVFAPRRPASPDVKRSIPFTSYVCAALRDPGRTLIRAVIAVTLAGIVAAPFIVFNGYIWKIACPGREWCSKSLPLAYTAVQKIYWDIGLFHYWTPEQIPNLIIALPVLIPTLAGIWAYFSGKTLSLHSEAAHRADSLASIQASTTYAISSAHNVRASAEVKEVKGDVQDETTGDEVARGPLLDAVYALSLFLALTLLFTSHTQIALRLAVTDPTLWWTLAANAGMRKAWIWWCFLWAAVGLALWSGHYPPA
ncbi:hypothetical protein A1Q2_07035 [Trichosporon asahii var. asahii CBS 8904]|uniref:GPI mannosyltransferase 2 n=2 Tax=Trichosporon asahii var. asahii TaxID=189963 RepID=K1VD32_TRIAC|nr:hypothetical protein A1Q1_07912 [Trichosporon asahii var. asahii CBS 2479]EJT50939.1 hypothetical protein A1Q1_07912 [Trichosporon asahii var. asahii CBS 2479]EKC98675.1 hypothetical protein A1Q2_07035 [Trichosporon asahii var. asahii CBS 8904]